MNLGFSDLITASAIKFSVAQRGDAIYSVGSASYADGRTMPIDLTDTQKLLTSYSLPSRLRYGFDYTGCLTVGDALQLTPDQLQRLPRSGVATLQKWLDFLKTGLTVDDLKQARQMHLSFGEILGLTMKNEALTDLSILKHRRISDEEITDEACKWVNCSTFPFEAFRMGARIARQWESRLLAATKKITPVRVRAACGHEYKTGILHSDEDDFREQRAVLATLVCLACVEETQEVHGEVLPFVQAMENREVIIRPPLKIVSGGQTGADRAALDWAIRNNIPHGGYCTKGRRAEDGTISATYQLQELKSANYAARTKRNVEESDGTVIFTIKETMTGGTRLTAQHAIKKGKPLLHLCRTNNITETANRLQAFLIANNIHILNVAGPRASNEPGVGAFVEQTLDAWWSATTVVGTPPQE